jgi:hypothetical protein
LDEGVPSGWIVKKADGKLYLFDMDGLYVDRQDYENNDLLDFDIDTHYRPSIPSSSRPNPK